MTVLLGTWRGRGMTETTGLEDVSYSVRICSRCGARFVQERPAGGRARWVCATCGKHAR